ncbi:hypothetical protein D3C80_1709820 [compost metagenome]
MRKKAAENRQWPVQQQGDGGHADEVIGHAGVEIAPDHPQRKQAEHRAEQQVLTAAVGEQLNPAGSADRPDQQGHKTEPAKGKAGTGQYLCADHLTHAPVSRVDKRESTPILGSIRLL